MRPRKRLMRSIYRCCTIYCGGMYMNQFRMKLLPEYFEELEKGTEYTEIRCNDENRQRIKPGDQIILENTETRK